MKEVIEQLRKYRHAIYDLDGTLVNLGVDWLGLKKELSTVYLNRTGGKLDFNSLETALFAIKNKNKELYGELFKIAERFELSATDNVPNKALLDHIDQAEWQNFGIFTMNTAKCARTFLKGNLNRQPEIIVAKDNYINPKPSGADVEHIIKRLGAVKKETVMLGDSVLDEGSARQAGIAFIKVGPFL